MANGNAGGAGSPTLTGQEWCGDVRYFLKEYPKALENFSRGIAVNLLVDRYYRNLASAWTASHKFGNAAGDFKTASRVNTDTTVIEESESRSTRGKAS